MTNTATQYTLPSGCGGRGVTAAVAAGERSTRRRPSPRSSRSWRPTPRSASPGRPWSQVRQTYTLTLTPTSPVTTFGSVRVAIDGHRWVPLRVQVFAKGDGSAVLSAGFKRVSFSAISGSLFTLQPAERRHRRPQAARHRAGRAGEGPAGKVGAGEGAAAHKAPLTLAQAKAAGAVPAHAVVDSRRRRRSAARSSRRRRQGAGRDRQPDGPAGNDDRGARQASDRRARLRHGLRHGAGRRVEDDRGTGRPGRSSSSASSRRSARRPSTACRLPSCRPRWARRSRSGRVTCG